MDILQAALIFLVLVLSVILSVIGLQVFFILRDLKRSVDKIDLIVNNAKNLTEGIKKPIQAAADLSTAVETGVQMVKNFNRAKQAKKLFKRTRVLR